MCIDFSRAGRGRQVNNRNLKTYFVIYTEGETEQLYFDALKQELPRGILTVESVNMKKNGVTLIEDVLRKEKNVKYIVDTYWVVFDKDDLSDKQIKDAFKLAKQHNFEVAYSNESFELWYLLHLCGVTSHINRKDFIKQIEKELKKEKVIYSYNKTDNTFYNKILKPNGDRDKAISRAKSLENDKMANPYTSVYKLVEELLKYK